MNQVRSRDHRMRSLRFTRMRIDLRLHRRSTWRISAAEIDIYNVILCRCKLRLGEERQQMIVATMPVQNQNLLAAIPSHLIRRLLQQFQLQPWTVRDRSRLMFSLEDLSEVIFRKHDSVLLLRAMQSQIARID